MLSDEVDFDSEELEELAGAGAAVSDFAAVLESDVSDFAADPFSPFVVELPFA